MQFISYNHIIHFNKCLEIYQSNCPKYFLEEETKDFVSWLSKTNEYPYWLISVGEKIVGCGGVYFTKPTDKIKPVVENEVGFAWGMVGNQFHKMGYGKALSLFRINYLKTHYPNRPIVLRTSQHTFPFFQKLGFEILEFQKNGFGAEMDKYTLVHKC